MWPKKERVIYGKLGDSSLTYFSVFVVLYLEFVENIDQMPKVLFAITS